MRRVLEWLCSNRGGTTAAVARGGVWLLIGDGLNRLAGVCKILLLSRLLAPQAFGLMGIATLLAQWLGYFSQTGFDAALIHKREDIRPYLDTAWTVQMARSLGVALALYLGAPIGAAFFSSPESVPVIQAIAIPAALYAFQNPAIVYLRKELSFRREVLWRFTGTATGLLVAIPVAIADRSVWALVWSVVASRFVETALSYWVVPYRPRLRFDWRRVRELGRYGKWVFGYNVLNFCELYADSAWVGKFCGVTGLGYYQVASQLSTTPLSQISNNIYGLLFPAFMRKPERGELAGPVLALVRLMSIALLPAACLVALFRVEIVNLALGSKWLPAAGILALLFWAGTAKAAAAVAMPLFMSAGKPDLTARTSFVKLILFAAAVYPLTAVWGPAGAAAALAAAATLGAVYQLSLLAGVLKLHARVVLLAAASGVVFCAPVAVLWAATRTAPGSAYAAAPAAAALHAALVAYTARRMLKQFGTGRAEP